MIAPSRWWWCSAPLSGDDVEQEASGGDERHPCQYRPGHASNRSRQEKCMSTVPAAKRGLQDRQNMGPV